MKITLEVLDEKLNNIHRDIKEIKGDVKANTSFRLQAKGMITGFVAIGSLAGALLMWIISKVFK